MKRITILAAAALALSAAFSACNPGTKAPYRDLEAAVDSTRTALAEQNPRFADAFDLEYDKLTNTVIYTARVPGKADSERFAPHASTIEDTFMHSLFTDDDYHLCDAIMDAHSNVEIVFAGDEDSKYSVLIQASTLEKYQSVLKAQ